MKSVMLQWLRCPICQSRFNARMRSPTRDVEDYDILVCRCSQYPVVAGIPVLKNGIIGTARQTSGEVISLIQVGRYQEALLSLAMPPTPPPPTLVPTWMNTLPSIKGVNRVKALAHRWVLRHRRGRIAALITSPGDEATATDFLDGYFLRSGLNNSPASAFYEQDHPEYEQYLPQEVSVDSEVLRDVHDGKRTPAMERLIEQCVVVGMPERFYAGRRKMTGMLAAMWATLLTVASIASEACLEATAFRPY
jgi:uncharacterized protein YbaR (Trm112 family)